MVGIAGAAVDVASAASRAAEEYSSSIVADASCVADLVEVSLVFIDLV